MDCSLPGSSVSGIFQARILSGLQFPPLGDLPFPGIEPMSPVSPALQADSLPAESLGKLKKCLTLYDLMDCSLPGSSVHRILQASILEWIAVPFFRESSLPRDRTWVFCIAGGFFTVCPPGKPSRSYGNRQTVFQSDLTILHCHKWEFFIQTHMPAFGVVSVLDFV